MNAIEVEGLAKTFPGGIEAVAGIDLVVGEAEIVGFLGPNGAGKSTTARILTTLLRPTAGRARVAGLDVVSHAAEVRRVIGVALQEAGLDRLATGREMLILQSRLHGLRGLEAHRRAEEVLEIVGLSGAADRRVRTYSGGMKRRLDLASALVHRPRVLFLDEPTTGLDVTSRHAIWEEVRRLNQEEGIPVFLTTQYLEEADRVVERVAIIDHGRIVAEGTPDELKASIGSDVVTVELPAGRPEDATAALSRLEGLRDFKLEPTGLTLFVNDGQGAVANAIRLLDEASVPVGAVAVSRPTLDEVFLRATGSRLEGARPAEHVEEGT
ncbi:MAG TPA: ATP-binding cassette domain-containing protein [Actinomycetota bacterium]|nr:ATP-binding cassette domain-containing protein [Actinomycetota bacterium]